MDTWLKGVAVGLGVGYFLGQYGVAAIFWMILVAALVWGLWSYDQFRKNHLPAHEIGGERFKGKVFGHRGCRLADGSIPENTLAAFRYAIENGADGIELDVQLTKDGKAVVIHDLHVGRVLEGFKGSGLVSEMTLKEMKKLRYKSSVKNKEVIPTLEEAIKFCSQKNVYLMLEMKISSVYLSRLVVDLLVKYKMMEKTCVISFLPEAIYYVRLYHKRAHTCILVPNIHKDTWKQLLGTKATLLKYGYFILGPIARYVVAEFQPDHNGVSMIGFDFATNVTKTLRDKYLAKGIHTYTWTINTKEEAEICRSMDLAFTTDDVRAIV